MKPKAKTYAQTHKQAAQNELAARTALLEGKGNSQDAIQRDTIIRQLKAAIRTANRRLAGAAAMEQLIARKAEDKATKAANAEAKQAAKPAPEKEAPKPKKEKKAKEKK